jgi:hypothetical protein
LPERIETSSPMMVGSRETAARRWTSIVLRSLHLAGVVDAALGVLGHGTPHAAGIVLMLVTGFALYGIDLWQNHGLWREVAGVFIVVKLLGLAAMLALPAIAALLFWLLLIASSIISHAPHALRHRRLIGGRGGVP